MIEKIYRSELFNRLIDMYAPKHLIEDAKQHIILILAENSDKKLKEIEEKNYLNYFIIRIIKNQLLSSSSPFYRTFRKQIEYDKIEHLYDDVDDSVIDEKIENENRLKKINTLLEELHWYDSTLYKLKYFEGKSYNDLVSETKIPRISLWTTITNVHEYIKKNIK